MIAILTFLCELSEDSGITSFSDDKACRLEAGAPGYTQPIEKEKRFSDVPKDIRASLPKATCAHDCPFSLSFTP